MPDCAQGVKWFEEDKEVDSTKESKREKEHGDM